MVKNGYVTPSRQNPEALPTKSMNSMEDIPDDILCRPDVETTGKHSHTSKKNKKSKKHKLNDNEDGRMEDTESDGIYIQPNARPNDNISVVDSSQNFSPRKEKQFVPKIIISRNTEDFNKFVVKENLTTCDKHEKGHKRRRSTEDASLDMHDGKRSKSDQETAESTVKKVPLVPKLDRRLSIRLEDAYGEYRLHLFS